jgi:adenylate kinase family enzyme
MKNRIHIFGASGSGTTTIAKAVSEKLGYVHFDTDSYYWYPTEIPFTSPRPIEERLELMDKDLSRQEKWVLSGSLDSWGNPLVPLFELVAFVYVPQDIRLARLEKRERERYGSEVLPGGSRYEATVEFLKWAAGYDSGLLTGRSLPRHENWMAKLECELIKITNHSLEDSINAVISAITGGEKAKP